MLVRRRLRHFSAGLYELARHPGAQRQLREELQKAKADAGSEGREVTVSEMEGLPYFNAVIKVGHHYHLQGLLLYN